jgi:predicted ArsR family transcriptional regulator
VKYKGTIVNKVEVSKEVQERIFNYKHGKEITTQEAAKAIGVEESTARRHLNALVFNGLMSRTTRNRVKYFLAIKSPSHFFYIDFKYIEPAMRMTDTAETSHLNSTLKLWLGYPTFSGRAITSPARTISGW